MNLQIHIQETGNIAELQSDKIYSTVNDFLDIIGNANFQGAEKIIIHKQNIHPDFFDLKTGLAGEILQKFSTYRQKLAIIGDFSTFTSKNFKDFVRESNRFGHILFVNNVFEAIVRI